MAERTGEQAMHGQTGRVLVEPPLVISMTLLPRKESAKVEKSSAYLTSYRLCPIALPPSEACFLSTAGSSQHTKCVQKNQDESRTIQLHGIEVPDPLQNHQAVPEGVVQNKAGGCGVFLANVDQVRG